MGDHQQKIEDGFTRIRSGLSDGQSQVEALLSLLKDRVAAEEAYSRALLRLSKQNLALDERVMEPAIFEALASLRGDLANESVQHSELGSSVQRDAVEPLVRLREGGESVHRLITAQARQTMADVKTAVERCKRHYSKYQQLHNKAVIACTAAGIPCPQLMQPASDTSGSASTGSSSSSGGGGIGGGGKLVSTHGSSRNLINSGSSSSSSSSSNVIAEVVHASTGVISASSTVSTAGISPADASSSSATSSSSSSQTLLQQQLVTPSSSSDMFSGLIVEAAQTSSSDAASIGDGEGSIRFSAAADPGQQGIVTGNAPRSRRPSGAGSEFSHNSAENNYNNNNNVVDSSIAVRIRNMASGFMGTMSVPPTTAVATANANMTAAERIELARSVASAAIQTSIEAWAEYLHSWSYLCKAREVCLRQLEASIVIVSDHERKRVTEFSDSLRRYTVFISSMHANLQFDVQRLSGHFEEIASAKATTLTSLSAIRSSEATVAALGTTIAALAESAAASAAAAGATAGISFAPITTTPISSTPLSIFGSYDPSSTSSNTRRMSGFEGVSLDGSSVEGDIQRKDSFGPVSVSIRRDSSSVFTPPGGVAGSVILSSNPSNQSIVANSSKAPGASVVAIESSSSGSSSPQALARMGRSMIASIPTMALPSSDEAAAAAAAAAASSAAAMKTVAARLLNATSSSSSSSSSLSSSSSSSVLNSKNSTSNKPAASSPLAPKVGIAIDGFSSAAQAAATSSISSLSSWGSGMAKFGSALAASASLHGGHPPRPFSSSSSSSSSLSSKQTNGSSVSMSVSVSGVVRNQGALGAGSKGVSEAAAMFAKLRIENSAIEYFVAALFDPHEKLVKLAPDGASVIAIPPDSTGSEGDVFGNDGDFNNSSDSVFGDSDKNQEAIPTLSLADFATGRSTPASPSNDVSRSRGGTVGGVTSTGSETGVSRSSFDLDGVGGDAVFAAIVPPPPLPIRARAETATAGHVLRRAVAAGEMNPAVVPLLPQVRKLLKHSPDGLSRFVMGMDARRGEGAQLLRPCFDALASIMKIALDVAESRSAFGEARTLLVISQTLYTIIPANSDIDAVDPSVLAALEASATPKADGTAATSTASGPAPAQHHSVGRPTRLYLQMRVRTHSLWQSVQFWETAIFDSIGSEMSKMKSQRSSTGMRKLTGGEAVQSPGEREREQDLLLGQLGFFAYQMIDFCVPQETVKKVLEKYGKFINLDSAHIATLMNSLASFADARRVLDTT
jgi:hypothetical protein